MKFEKNVRYIYTGPQSETGLCLTCGNFEKYEITPISYEYKLNITLTGNIYLGLPENISSINNTNAYHLYRESTSINTTTLKNQFNQILANGSSGLGFSVAQGNNDYGDLNSNYIIQTKTLCTLGEITNYSNLFSSATTKGLKSYEWEFEKHEGIEVYKTKSKLFTIRNITDGGIDNNMISVSFKYEKNDNGDPNYRTDIKPTIVLYLITPPFQNTNISPFDRAHAAKNYDDDLGVFKCVLVADEGMTSSSLKMRYANLLNGNSGNFNINSEEIFYTSNSTETTTDNGVRKITRNYIIQNALFTCWD